MVANVEYIGDGGLFDSCQADARADLFSVVEVRSVAPAIALLLLVAGLFHNLKLNLAKIKGEQFYPSDKVLHQPQQQQLIQKHFYHFQFF